jgi:hypothetical protein
MSATWGVASFITRALGSLNQQNSSLATVCTLLFLLAPLWINAFVYITVGRLVHFLHPEKRVWGLEAVKMGRWFVWLDVLSFLIQVTEGLMMDQDNGGKVMEIGKDVYITRVGMQQVFIFLFLVFIIRFHLEMLRIERKDIPGISNRRWKWLIHTLCTVLVLITVRIIFRPVEISAGADSNTNALISTEGYVLGLDAVPMMLALLLLAVVHPGVVLRGPGSEFPSKKERKAEKKAGKAEKKFSNAERRAGRYSRKCGSEEEDVEMARA